ncbi:hypothetical protein C7391_0430 [Methanimicrococcus blatticola]|uniref:Uncharacterized protein n=1 Tax=Methanimicrococcus blatticola TaxID=91560 RepID=A0A484F5T7_9EURY|nr:hypothetical protein C7391_0430 [Methanimicrococcus blatticola]
MQPPANFRFRAVRSSEPDFDLSRAKRETEICGFVPGRYSKNGKLFLTTIIVLPVPGLICASASFYHINCLSAGTRFDWRICFFLSHPFACANGALPPAVQVAAATHRSSCRCYPPFKLPLLPTVQVTAATHRSSHRCDLPSKLPLLPATAKMPRANCTVFRNFSKPRVDFKIFQNRERFQNISKTEIDFSNRKGKEKKKRKKGKNGEINGGGKKRKIMDKCCFLKNILNLFRERFKRLHFWLGDI